MQHTIGGRKPVAPLLPVKKYRAGDN